MKKSENRKEMFDKYFKLSSLLSKVANDFEHACKFGNCKNNDEYAYCHNRSKHYFTLSQFSCWYAYKFYSDFRKETWRTWKSYNDVPRYITLKDMLNEINGL